MLKRQYNEIASHLNQVPYTGSDECARDMLCVCWDIAAQPLARRHIEFVFDFSEVTRASGWQQWLATEQRPAV